MVTYSPVRNFRQMEMIALVFGHPWKSGAAVLVAAERSGSDFIVVVGARCNLRKGRRNEYTVKSSYRSP